MSLTNLNRERHKRLRLLARNFVRVALPEANGRQEELISSLTNVLENVDRFARRDVSRLGVEDVTPYKMEY